MSRPHPHFIALRSAAAKRAEAAGRVTHHRDDMVLFWKPPCVFGQWTESPFKVDGETYVTAEQFMMAEKARLFGDDEIRKQILGTTDPKAQKALGRKVKGFDEATWVANRLEIVVRGNLAKFSQNSEMKEELLATGDKLLVEASPLDRIWGIGLGAENPKAWRKETWRGLNLLGQALMTVRSMLREEGVEQKKPRVGS